MHTMHKAHAKIMLDVPSYNITTGTAGPLLSVFVMLVVQLLECLYSLCAMRVCTGVALNMGSVTPCRNLPLDPACNMQCCMASCSMLW